MDNLIPSPVEQKRPGVISEKLCHVFSSAKFRHEEKTLAIQGQVTKGIVRQSCQDSALIYRDGKSTVLGVFDGHESSGGTVSSLVAGFILDAIEISKNLPSVLFMAKQMLDEYAIAHPSTIIGGTTATLVHILPDWSFYAATVADSTVLQVGEHVTDFFPQTHYFSQENKDFIPIIGAHHSDYVETRNLIDTSIRPYHTYTPTFRCGKLNPGEKLFLVTDGVMKSLDIKIDPEGRITEAPDLASFLRVSDDAFSVVRGMEAVCEKYLGDNVFPGKVVYPEGDDMSVVMIRRLE